MVGWLVGWFDAHRKHSTHAVHAKCEHTNNVPIKPITNCPSVWHAQIVAHSPRFIEFTYRLIPMCRFDTQTEFIIFAVNLPTEKANFEFLSQRIWVASPGTIVDKYFY